MVWRVWSRLILLSLCLAYHPSVGSQRQEPIPAPDSITIAAGVEFSQQITRVGPDLMQVSMLAFDPQQVDLRPIWAEPNRLIGLRTLAEMVQQQGAIAGINGGFFNRHTQQPIGAIRVQGEWISSPTLGRGAVGWTEQGEFLFDRLDWQGQIQTPSTAVALVGINTALVVPGLSQYTPAWGERYTTLTDDELIIEVRQDRVQALYPTTAAGNRTVAIPPQGSLIVGRQEQGRWQGYQLGVGDPIQIQITPDPIPFADYPYILGAGPLLIRQGQIVVDGEQEQFQSGFESRRAARSAIGQLEDGTILLLTIGGAEEHSGVSLGTLAQLMQSLGCREALNLDGGSSSTLTIRKQMNHPAPTPLQPRVHNGLGIFSSDPMGF